jgi:hypothetical protein
MSEHDDTAIRASDAWLEQLLADDGRDHRAGYLADDGFTARVAAALPAPPAVPAWRKPVVALLWAVAAVAVALALPEALADAASAIVRLLGHQRISLANVALGLAVLGAASWASAVYALRRTR